MRQKRPGGGAAVARTVEADYVPAARSGSGSLVHEGSPTDF